MTNCVLLITNKGWASLNSILQNNAFHFLFSCSNGFGVSQE